MRGLVAEVVARPVGALAAAPQQLVADVERRVRPAALGQVADHRRDALIALDQDHVALAQPRFERAEVVARAPLVVRERLEQVVDDAVDEPASQAQRPRLLSMLAAPACFTRRGSIGQHRPPCRPPLPLARPLAARAALALARRLDRGDGALRRADARGRSRSYPTRRSRAIWCADCSIRCSRPAPSRASGSRRWAPRSVAGGSRSSFPLLLSIDLPRQPVRRLAGGG